MKLDLKNISRATDKTVTEITIGRDWDKVGQTRIILGEISLTEGDSRFRGQWSLKAYWNNMTDGEHDSAYILWLPLVGLKLDMIHYGCTVIEAFIGGEEGDFRVPSPDYGANCLKVAVKCGSCKGKESHLMLPDGLYVPPKNPELFSRLAGRIVEIRIYQPEKK